MMPICVVVKKTENYVLGRIEDKVVRKSFTADNDVKRVWDWMAD